MSEGIANTTVSITCPCCGRGWRPSEGVFSELVCELEGRDRRYDSARVLVDGLLDVLAHSPSELLPTDGGASVSCAVALPEL